MNNSESKPSLRLWMMLGCGTILYFFVLFLRSAVPGPIFDLLQKELGDKAAVATLGSMFMYAYGFTQLIAGLLVDKYGGSRVIFFGALLMCAGALMFPLSSGLHWFYAARLISGVGAGTIYLCLVKDAMLFPRKWYGILIGSIVTIGFLGSIVANSPFVWLVNKFDGDFSRVLLYVSYIMLFVLLAWLVADADRPTAPVDHSITISLAPYKEVVKKGANWMVFVFNSVNFALFCVLQTVVGHKFLEESMGMGISSAALVFTGTAAVTAASGLLFPIVSKATGERRALLCKIIGVITVVSQLVLLAMLHFGQQIPAIAIMIFLVLAFTMNSMVLAVPMLRSINSDHTIGVAVGILNFLNFIFVAIFGQVAGALMKHFSQLDKADANIAYEFFFLILGALSVLELICALRMKDKPD